MALLLGSSLLLAEDGLDAFDGQNDSQNDQQHAHDSLDVGAPVGAALLEQADLSLGVDEQRGDGNSQHEEHGTPAHEALAADVVQPGSDSQQSQSGEIMLIVFCRDKRVAKNTSQTANVRAKRVRCSGL